MASDDVVVLATSRAPLGLVGEGVHRLRTLPDADALALWKARARAGRASVGWAPERALELCHRLDNLPLALELAAARLRSMTVEDVLGGLTDRFSLLDDALRGLPERHASLWAMVDWSRELLDPSERDLLQRVSVVPAPFTAEAAIAVAGTQPHLVRRGLSTLVEQSLLALDEHGDGSARYRMLETVREYGEARLDAAGARADAMAGLVRWAGSRRVGSPTTSSARAGHRVRAVGAGAGDPRRGSALGVDHGDEIAPVRIASALFHLWSVRGAHVEVVSGRRASSRSMTGRPWIVGTFYGVSSGMPLPDADRVAAAGLFAAVNAGVARALRLAALRGGR